MIRARTALNSLTARRIASDDMEIDAEGADQSHDAFVPEAKRSGSLALLNRGQLDPLEERGRNGTALAGTLDCKQAEVGGTSLGLQLRQVLQLAVAAEVVGGVQTNSMRNARPSFRYSLIRESR